LLRQGERNGRSGFINVSAHHQAAEDGRFQSPRFPAGHTFSVLLAFCESPTNLTTSKEGHGLTADRIFDFLYPGAHDVSRAMGVAVEEGQTLPNLHVRIPRLVRHRVKGRVIGVLPQSKFRSIATPPKSSQAKGVSAGD
jgi:hypothetical protein